MPVQTGQRSSLSIYYLHAVLKHYLRGGGDLDELLAISRISRDLLNTETAPISPEQFCRLQANTMGMMGDEVLGYTGRPLPIGSWKMMCHAVISAETLDEALYRYCDFFNLIDWGIRFELREEGDKVVFSPVETTSEPLERYPYIFCMLNVFRFFSWLGEQFLPVARFDFACSMPGNHSDYKAMFVATPVFFEQPTYRMEILRKGLSGEIKQNVTSLRRHFRHPLYEMAILDYETPLLSGQIRKIIESDLVRPPGFASLAEQLGLHQQALRRRLADEGTTYREIKNKTRFDTAVYYLGKPHLSIESVSERAGFSEASAFIRAFRKWTGVSPHQYRQGSSEEPPLALEQ